MQMRFAKFTVAHELAHVWDHRSGHDLTFGLIKALDTWVCDSDSCEWPYAATYGIGSFIEGPGWEDWSESFASYVYADYYPKQGKLGLINGGIRKTYVLEKIHLVP